MKSTIALRPTTEQIDLFGEATHKRNNAEKVRDTVLPILKLSYSQTGNSVFEGSHWVVKASDGVPALRSIRDPRKLPRHAPTETGTAIRGNGCRKSRIATAANSGSSKMR